VSVPIPEVRPATEARGDLLLELVQGARHALVARGESVTSAWVEEAAADLKAGRQAGWTVGDRGLAFASSRPKRTFAHVHVTDGPEPVEIAETLIATLITHVGPGVERLEAGISGLSETEEAGLAARFLVVAGSSVLLRARMERPVPPALPGTSLADPPGVERTSVRTIPVAAIAELDWRSFQGTPDERLVADTVEEDRQSLEEILAGKLGRFLDESSCALLRDGNRLVGAVLVSEHDPRTAIILDLLVEPSERRQGLGKFLLLWALRALTALGYSTARLWVTEANRPARALYDSLGFTTTGRSRIFRYEPGVTTTDAHPQTAR
jgi:ribosomal protein S18 acetylase RimI-like enzyme